MLVFLCFSFYIFLFISYHLISLRFYDHPNLHFFFLYCQSEKNNVTPLLLSISFQVSLLSFQKPFQRNHPHAYKHTHMHSSMKVFYFSKYNIHTEIYRWKESKHVLNKAGNLRKECSHMAYTKEDLIFPSHLYDRTLSQNCCVFFKSLFEQKSFSIGQHQTRSCQCFQQPPSALPVAAKYNPLWRGQRNKEKKLMDYYLKPSWLLVTDCPYCFDFVTWRKSQAWILVCLCRPQAA